MLKLSVNILTWNTWPTLKETLQVLVSELMDINSEVIIVDNGSTDGCQNAATIRNAENLGISKGKNQGIDASKGEYLLLLDGDVVPPRNSIKSLLAYMEAYPELDALGFFPNKWSNQRNVNGQVHHEEICRELVGIKQHDGHACYFGMYRRWMFDEGLRFDETFGPGYGYEDLDFWKQMDSRGIKQYFAHINHAGGKYFHAINSSIPQIGRMNYERQLKERQRIFKDKWEPVNVG